MNVYAYMITKDEAGSYLDACLAWAKSRFDGIAVYDDRSDDDTTDIAKQRGAKVCVRPEGTPSFLEHEGQFRQAAWGWCEDVFDPGDDDWIFALDADEFPTFERDDLAAVLEESDVDGVQMPIHEVFHIDDGFHVRIDGLWGRIRGVRAARWRSKGEFRDLAMGCGSVPAYALADCSYVPTLELLHLGYAEKQDRKEKYVRYTTMANHGHNDGHVKSILHPPRLAMWGGVMPEVWKGKQ